MCQMARLIPDQTLSLPLSGPSQEVTSRVAAIGFGHRLLQKRMQHVVEHPNGAAKFQIAGLLTPETAQLVLLRPLGFP